MFCAFCKKDSVKEVVTVYERNIHGQRYIVENVPALFCSTCGEYYFDNQVVLAIKEKIFQHEQENNGRTKLYDYSRIK